MNNRKKYYYKLDLIRIVSCIGVLLYHLGLLKGGFLAVCTFFVLSGYLSYTSLNNKEFSLKEYYKSKFLHIYLPLIVVVFITISITSFFDNIYWFNMKPETTSVLFGYNNYWQLSAQTDYFARFVSSPFMHFWYIAILLQFDIVFPFLYLIIKKIKKNTWNWLPLVILIILSLLSILYFIHISETDIFKSYYLLTTRIHSLLIGVILAYIEIEYPKSIPKLNSRLVLNIIYFEYLITFIILLFVGDVNSSYTMFMFLSTLLSFQTIRYSTLDEKEYPIIKKIASITYEVYLLQYPLIFMFNYVDIESYIKIIIIIILDIILSIFIHFTLSFKDDKNKYYRLPLQILLGIFVSYGLFQYAISKDVTKEINSLKMQLTTNEDLIIKRQKEYLYKEQEEQDNWNKVLSDFDAGEKEINNIVSNLSVVGVGDSVMLGAVPVLYDTFPNGYFDAKVNRTDYEANKILQDIKNRGLLSDNIVINLGTNGQCGTPCQEEIIATCEGRNIYWINVTNDYEIHVNDGLNYLANRHNNVHIIDWNSISNGHGDYFIADGIHLTYSGMIAYSKAIYDTIYDKYHKDFLDKKNKVLEEHELELKSKKSFYGNDTLLNIYSDLNNSYPESDFNIKQEYLFKDIYNDIKNNKTNYNVIISIDTIDGISMEDYLKIISLLEDHEIYIIFSYNKPYSFNNNNVHIIDFYSELNNNSNYFNVDHKHFSDEGNRILESLINNSFSNKKELLSKGALF